MPNVIPFKMLMMISSLILSKNKNKQKTMMILIEDGIFCFFSFFDNHIWINLPTELNDLLDSMNNVVYNNKKNNQSIRM